MNVLSMSSETWPSKSAGSMGGGGMTFEHAVVLAGRQANVKVGFERLGHLPGEERADGVARDAAHDLTDEVALRQRVVARGRARLPPRRLGGEPGRAELPVGELLGDERLLPAAQAGGVPHYLAHLHPFLAVGRELGQ